MKTKIGIYNLHMQAKGGGEKRTLALADHLSRSHHVWLFVDEPLDPVPLERYFDVDLSRVTLVVLNKNSRIAYNPPHRPLTRRWHESRARLDHFRQIKAFDLDIFINNSHCSDLPCPAARGIYMCMFPNALPPSFTAMSFPRRAYHSCMDWVERRVMGRRGGDFLDSYSVVTANSRFTAEWVEKMWGRRSEIIYSVCDNMGPVAEKEKIILNVGRFIVRSEGTLYKRQDVLLDAFLGLSDIQRDGWQLHFVGSVARDARSTALIARLEEAADGRPVFFHFDADLDTLRDLYRRAPLYWHATGYGFPAHEHPNLQEHFGITTVEAMSAGAVPVAINSGGQREIISHAVDGFLWDEPSALTSQTARLIEDPRLLGRLSLQATSSSIRFSRAAFNARMDAIIGQLMHPRRYN